MSNYNDYIPNKPETKLVQVKIDKPLYLKIKSELNVNGWTWHDFVTGLFKKYLDDNRRKK